MVDILAQTAIADFDAPSISPAKAKKESAETERVEALSMDMGASMSASMDTPVPASGSMILSESQDPFGGSVNDTNKTDNTGPMVFSEKFLRADYEGADYGLIDNGVDIVHVGARSNKCCVVL